MPKSTKINTVTDAMNTMKQVMLLAYSVLHPQHPKTWQEVLAKRVYMVRSLGWLKALQRRLPHTSKLEENIKVYKLYHAGIIVLIKELENKLKNEA